MGTDAGKSSMNKRMIGSLIVLMLAIPIAGTSQDLRAEAEQAWERARAEDAAFRVSPPDTRTRSEHLRIIRLYEQVYLTTPHSGYSDDALIQIATLYEETGARADAVRTLRFLISDYPSSKHVPEARQRITRLDGPVEPLASASPPPADGEISVDGVRYYESPDSMRVVIDMQGQPAFTRGEVPDPPRAYLDLANARLGSSLPQREFAVGSGLLRGIRLGQYDSETVRIVFDLAEARELETTVLTDPSRLVIDLRSPGEAVASMTPAEDAPQATAAPSAPQPAPVAAAPALPTQNGAHTLSRGLGLKPHRVVIDPGHGGHDPGTIGPSGLSEAELVLDVAKRLRDRILADLPDADVILTREDDTFVPLEARPSRANTAEADLFISIHANSSRTRSIRGFETYFLNLNTSKDAMEVAARENAFSERATSELPKIVSEIMTQEWLDESREFAGHVQRALASESDMGRDRGVKQAPLVVLLGAKMPSVLAEISFISNPDDERLLKGDVRRQQIADALFEGVRSYFGTLSGFRTAEVRD
jgi:N-acetylmuramoyl-L-alanine amidase